MSVFDDIFGEPQKPPTHGLRDYELHLAQMTKELADWNGLTLNSSRVELLHSMMVRIRALEAKLSATS